MTRARATSELRALFSQVKHDHPLVYDPAKRYIHGRAYGLTVPGMVLQFPHLFPTQASAEKYARVFELMAPGVAQLADRDAAAGAAGSIISAGRAITRSATSTGSGASTATSG